MIDFLILIYHYFRGSDYIYYLFLMGNKLDLEAKICYSCEGSPIEMIMKELKGKKNFPKLPKEREIEKKYKEWGTKVF